MVLEVIFIIILSLSQNVECVLWLVNLHAGGSVSLCSLFTSNCCLNQNFSPLSEPRDVINLIIYKPHFHSLLL